MQDFWMWDRIRQVHVDFHMPEFPKEAIKKFNAIEFVGELKRAKVNMAAIFCKCHFGNAFYNTEVGHKHSGLKEDFFGEILEEAHKHDIKILAYYSLGTDEHAVKNNPDWYQVDEDGKIRDGNGTVWHRPCINSPYREELVLPQIKEITRNYDIDGVFIDIPYIQHHICFCHYCKKKFRDEYGVELNRELYDTRKDRIVEFGKSSAIRCLQEIYLTVKSIKPDVPIGANCAYKMGEPRELKEINDFGVWESQPAAGSYLYHSVKARWARIQDAPVQIMTVRFTEGWGMMSCKTPEQLKYEAATIMANGGTLNIGDQVMPDGTLQKGFYDVLKEVFSFVEEREKYATRAKSVPHIALIANYTTNRYWDQGDFSTLGACKMLIEGHQQFDIFYNDEFPDLESYSLVVLPESVQLSQESVERIREFIWNGGKLVAAGKASIAKGASNFGLADVYGLSYLEYAPYRFGYMSINEELWKGTARIPQLVDAGFIKAVATTADVLSYVQWPCGESVPSRAFRHPLPPPGERSDFPAISYNPFGKGEAIYFAAPIFQTYWEQNHFWLKYIFSNCLNFLDESKPFVLEGYPGLELVMTTKENKLYLHLINFQNTHSGNRTTSFYDPIEHIIPIYNVPIKIRDFGINQVLVQPEEQAIEFAVEGDYIAFMIPRIDIYTILELGLGERGGGYDD